MEKIKGFLSRCCLNRDLNEDTEGDMERSEKKKDSGRRSLTYKRSQRVSAHSARSYSDWCQ